MAELNGRPATAAELEALALGNYGHFTTVRIETDGVRGLERHLRRLAGATRRLFDTDLDLAHARACLRHATEDRPRPLVARVTVFDPALGAGHPGADAHPRVLVTTREAPAWPCPPLRARSVRYQRELPEVKHTAVFGALRHRREAQRAGFDDVVLVDDAGRLAELATASLAVVLDGRLVRPDAAALPGVTADLAATGDPEPVPLAALDRIEAAAALSSVVGVRTIAAIDDHELAPRHPLIEELRTAYASVPCEPL